MARLSPLPVSAWPAADRTAWDEAFTARHSLFGPTGAGHDLSPRTAKIYRTAYGIWLRYLVDSDELDPVALPDARVTLKRLDGWVEAMRGAGRIDSTIALYLMSLHATLRLVAPSSDTSFILKPRGMPLASLLPSKPKPFVPRDTMDVMRHVRALHEAGLRARSPDARRTSSRDAALMGLFAMGAPRVSSVAAMRLGTHIRVLHDGCFECRFPAEDVKGGRHQNLLPLDEACSALMRDYLSQARPLFDNAAATDALWLGKQGEPLDHAGLTRIFRHRTREWFGEAAGPHTARKWLRSTAARRSPEAAFDAAETMGHTPRVSLLHYAEANEIGAALRYGQQIRDLRRQTAGLAERFFAEREGR